MQKEEMVNFHKIFKILMITGKTTRISEVEEEVADLGKIEGVEGGTVGRTVMVLITATNNKRQKIKLLS